MTPKLIIALAAALTLPTVARPGSARAATAEVPAKAATAWRQNAHSQVRIVLPLTQAVAGRDVLEGVVQMRTAPHWHVYWKNSGDAGFAPSLVPDNSSALAEAELEWPAPRRFLLKGGLQAFGYEGEVAYPARFVLKAPARAGQPLSLGVAVDYLVCEDECVPYRYDFSLTLPVGEADVAEPEGAALLAAAKQTLPQAALPGQIRHRFVDDSRGLRIETAVDDPETDVFFEAHPLFEFGAPVQAPGLRVTPLKKKRAGPLPLVTEVLSTLVPASGRAIEGRSALALVGDDEAGDDADSTPPATADASLWLILLLGVFGGALLNLMPCVLPVLSLKLLGVMQHQAQARRSALWSVAGIMTSFMALAALVLALRAGGRQAGWGVQFQEPMFVAFLTVVVVLFALNLWGVFEVPLPAALGRLGGAGAQGGVALSSFTSGLFATLLATPCSAPFLGTAVAFALTSSSAVVVAVFAAVGVGLGAPYLLLAATPRAVALLPKPGAWMTTLKQALGFALAATAVWLLFVLRGQLPAASVALVELGLLGLAASAWAKERAPLGGVGRRLGVVVMLGFALGTVALASDADAPQETADALRWEPFSEARLAELQRNGQAHFVDVTADWCFTCKVNERVVLAAPTVVAALRESGAVLLRADWTKRDAAIAAFLARNGRTGIPFYSYTPPRGVARVLPELLTEGLVLEALGKKEP